MNMYDIIKQKRDGKKLTRKDLEFFVTEYTKGSIPDYQASALLMAMFIQGLDKEETVWMTTAMRDSGDVMDLSQIAGIKVDKHSTGGVGDKTTLIVAPLAAACGVPIAKMSGRSLGFTGGTVDKMESIPGFKTSLSISDFIKQVNTIGIAIIGQTGDIAPADKKIYALRDVTATVDNLNLITASIMSKKLASGSDAIVLDVKTGKGAFMKKRKDAVDLGELMVEIGRSHDKETYAVITDMNQPLGKAVGNSLEVIEAIETLKGQGPDDITQLSRVLAGIMIYAGGRADIPQDGIKMASKALAEGLGLKKLKEFIKHQGGDERVVHNYSLFPRASISMNIFSEKTGYIREIDAEIIGMASQHSGAGRVTKGDAIDLSAGILLHKKVGDKVNTGEKLATVYGNDEIKVNAGAVEAQRAFQIGSERRPNPKLMKQFIGFLNTER